MGARIAPQKCYTCSTNSTAREWLRTNCWRRLQKTIMVVTDVRDLGAHWCIAGRKVATTLTNRMTDATPSITRLDMFKAPYEKKTAIIRAKLLPKGLYGCELGPINETAMRGFRAATATCLTYNTSRRSTDLTFAMCSRGGDLDPDIEVVRRRVAGFRRAMVVQDKAENMVKDIIKCYAEKGHPGICRGHDDPNLKNKQPAGEPTSKIRAEVRSQCKTRGPIGYMLESMHMQAAAMDENYEVHQFNQPSIKVMEVPYQHLTPMIRQMCGRNRTRAAEGTKG